LGKFGFQFSIDMKRLFIVTCLLLATIAGSYGQARGKEMKRKKLSKSEAANLTPEQRLVHETDRKTNGGKKKKLSTRQKAKIQRKQSRSARHTKQPASAPRSRPKS
jgi:hypothetical protein